MPDPQRGTDRLGRRAKRFLAPSQKYEIWLQLIRGETTVSEAADRLEVDRSTIMRIREVARQGALEALATSKPGTRPARRDAELEAARAEVDTPQRLLHKVHAAAASFCLPTWPAGPSVTPGQADR